jgi:hypothetical protein
VRSLEAQLKERERFGAAIFDEPEAPRDLPVLAEDQTLGAPDGPSGDAWSLAGSYFVLAAFVAAYRMVAFSGFEQSSLMFLGVPAFVGATIALTPAPSSSTARIVRGLTLALAMAAILMQEGTICLLMAAPLFYTVGVLAGLLLDFARSTTRRAPAFAGLLMLVLASAEGTIPELSLPSHEVVEVSRVVQGRPEQVRATLAATPVFDAQLPAYLRMGFPLPEKIEGRGLQTGDTRVVHFAGGEGSPGDLTLQIDEVSDHRVVFESLGDTSHIAHWLDWKRSTVQWQPEGPNTTRVTWTIEFKRLLSPAWYFSPWQRYAMSLAADYLITTAATP